jgi:PIN domain nuclease of toxin-antitoxin system
MKLLLDTHLLLWAAGQPERLSTDARALLADPGNALLFSAASLWEIAIKRGLGRDDFRADPRLLRRGLLDNGYDEVPVTGAMPSSWTACRRSTRIRSTASWSPNRWWKESRC